MRIFLRHGLTGPQALEVVAIAAGKGITLLAVGTKLGPELLVVGPIPHDQQAWLDQLAAGLEATSASKAEMKPRAA